MSKIGKALKALWWVLRRPVLLNRVLTDEDTWHSYVGKKYRMAGGLPVVQMDQLIAAESVELGPMTFLDGGSLPTDLMLLAGLAEQIQDCSYFEIGTWRGESVATVSPRALSCHTLCLSDEEMQQRGMHPGTIASHMQFSASLENVTQLRGDSREFDFAQLDRKFDLIFIDGDHHYDFVLNDTKRVFSHLVHEKSIVVWHDYGFHPDQLRYEVMAAILDGAGADRAKRIYHVAHTKSAIFTGEELPAAPADFTRVPGEFYKTGISRQKINESPS
jgi:predicted O-methyltransferase YrrM